MFEVKAHSPTLRQRQRRLTFVLLCVWLSGRFGPAFFARTLYFELAGWPVHFWMAAHGSIFAFNIIVVAYAWSMNGWQSQQAAKGMEEALGLDGQARPYFLEWMQALRVHRHDKLTENTKYF